MNVCKQILPLVFLSMLLSTKVLAQKTEVYGKLKSAFQNGQDAKESAEEVLELISKAMNSDDVDDIQYYARQAHKNSSWSSVPVYAFRALRNA